MKKIITFQKINDIFSFYFIDSKQYLQIKKIQDKSESPLKFESPKALNVEANERVIHLPFTHNIINNITHLTPVHKCTHPTRQKEVSEFDVKTTKKPIIDSNNESSAEELLKENGLASGMRNTAPDEQVIPEATNVEDTNHPSSDVSKDDVVGGGDDNDKGVIDGDEYDKEAVGGADDHRESTSAETSMEASAEVEDKAYEHSVEDIEVQWRRFNLDLLPKVRSLCCHYMRSASSSFSKRHTLHSRCFSARDLSWSCSSPRTWLDTVNSNFSTDSSLP